uniref:L-2-hydroxyglutarate dehydrogenase, mitochondrial n=1 Tax=Kalmanozyma brasiliensis (strain GHG001) TaxID=1365824 RepID=V5F1E2_KALBG
MAIAKAPELTVDHLVVGGGVVGLSIASALAARWPEKTTYLVERNKSFGEETSSRNSEVIHAGLYYPVDSLKTRLCLRGRELMYQRCQEQSIPHKQTKKLVVGADFSKGYLEKLQSHCDELGPLAPPTRLITGQEARELEPNLSDNIAWALLSERTGIVSSHELMASLERDLLEADNAEIVYDTKLVRVDPNEPDRSAVNSKRGGDGSQDGWIVQTVTSESSSSSSDADALLAKVVINTSGLNAPIVLNSLLSDLGGTQEDAIPMWHSKGNYASYKGKGATGIQHLIYPCPDTRNKGTHAHTSLGTHLTLDLDGNIRFGPDTEWISPPTSEKDAVDFWKRALVVDDSRIETMYDSITEYLPNIDKAGLAPDYAGIRPKLIGPDTKAFMDFQFLWHNSTGLAGQKLWQRAPGLPAPSTSCISKAKESVDKAEGGAMISLLGIESPGLTSSLAIGEMVREMIAKHFYNEHPTRQASSNKGARNEDHAHRLDAWA